MLKPVVLNLGVVRHFSRVARVFVRNPFVAYLDVVNMFNGCPFIALHLILGGNLDICVRDGLFLAFYSIRNCIYMCLMTHNSDRG